MADDRQRNDEGQYADRLPPERVLAVFDRSDDRARPVTASDVVDALDVSRRTALNKLNELVAAGTLDSRSVGARARVFWRPLPADADERAALLSTELGQPVTVGERVYEDGDSHPLDAPETPENTVEDSPEAVEADEHPVSTPEDVPATLDALNLDTDRRAAVRAMYDHLRDAGTARKSDFTDEVYPEHPAGFGSPDGWWNALGTGSTTADGVGSLADLPGVQKPPEGRPTWQFTPPGE